MVERLFYVYIEFFVSTRFVMHSQYRKVAHRIMAPGPADLQISRYERSRTSVRESWSSWGQNLPC
jgi:hypothetical protein